MLEDGPLSATELQRELKVRRKRLLNLLAEMVAEGSLERKKHADDRRKTLFEIPSQVPQ